MPISAGSMSIWTIFAPGIEVLEAAHRAVVEAHADADHDVGGVGRHVAVVVAVHAQEAVRQGVRVGDRGDAQQRRDDGGVDLLGDRAQLVGGAGEDDALAGQDDGLLGRVDEFGGAFDVVLGRARDDRIAAQMHALRVAVPVGGLDEYVLGDVDEHRPLAARGGDVEGLLDGLRHLAGAHDEVVVLRDRQRDAGDVGLLEAVAAEQVAGDVARQDDHRHGIHVGRADAGDEVGRAGAGGRQADAGATADAGVGVGGVGGRLLVPDEHVPDLGVLDEGVVERQHDAAGIAEQRLDALGLETLEQDLCAGQFHGWTSSFAGRVPWGIAGKENAGPHDRRCAPLCWATTTLRRPPRSAPLRLPRAGSRRAR